MQPVPRASLLLLALAACDPPPAPADPVVHPPPPRHTFDPPPPYLPELPVLPAANTCPLADRPAHVLTLTAAGLALDDAPLADATVLPAALADVHALSLAIDPDTLYSSVRLVLAALPAHPDLRLWIGVRPEFDRATIRHFPISRPQLGAPAPRTAPLPPFSYAVHLDHLGLQARPSDPLAYPLHTAITVNHLRVSAAHQIPWRSVAAALTGACDGAVLIDPPRGPPLSRIKVPTSLTNPKVTAEGALTADHIAKIARVHMHSDAYVCLNRLVTTNPRARGRVDVTFTIASSGKVPAATIDRSTLPDPDAATCLANAVTRWSFHKPADGRDVTAHITFVL